MSNSLSVGRVVKLGFLFSLVLLISWLLCLETAGFMRQTLGISLMKSFGYAIAIEALIIALSVVYLGDNALLAVAKAGVIAGAVSVIIIASSIYAVTPTLTRSTLSETDKLKMRALNDEVKARKQALEAVKGQRNNSAIQSRALQTALDDRAQFMGRLQADGKLEAVKTQTAWVIVALRCILEFANLLLVYGLRKTLTEDSEQAVVNPNLVFENFVNKRQPLVDEEQQSISKRPSLANEDEQPVTKRPSLVEKKQVVIKNPRATVLQAFPGSSCKKAPTGDYEVRTPNGKRLSAGGSGMVAWQNAAQNLKRERGLKC